MEQPYQLPLPPRRADLLAGDGGKLSLKVNAPGESRRVPNPLLFADASQPDIVRAHQKDLQCRSKVEEDLLALSSTWMGQRFTLQNHKALKLLSGLIYLSTSSLRGIQTLGEEFCDIRQVEVHVRVS